MASNKIVRGSERALESGARALGKADPHDLVSVTLKLRRQNPLPDVSSRPAKQLTHAEMATYGASAADIQKTKDELQKLGLTVSSTDATTRSVRAEGPVSAMETAFNVQLMQMEGKNGQYRGRVGAVHVPDALADIVVAVFGLDNRRMIRRGAPAQRPVSVDPTLTRSRSWFKPSELAALYSFPPGDGAGQSIGLLEFGGGYFPEDLAAFCTAVGAPNTAKIVPISVDHTPTNARDQVEGEVMLDVEIVAALCPKATIPVYFGQWSERGWVDILDRAVHDSVNKPSVLSVSYGLAEGQNIWTNQALDQINEALQEAALLGITVCVASGDDGSAAQVSDGHAHVSFPSSSPFVLAVGGTNLRVQQGARTETSWWQGTGERETDGGSTGGGISDHFKRQAWQDVERVQSVNPQSIDGRIVPDVSALANFGGYLLVVDGQAQPNGGTSAATPVWASLVGRINQNLKNGKRVGYLTPLLYKVTGSGGAKLGAVGCNDVKSGHSNATAAVGGYHARNGFDAVTGWGSPKGTALLEALEPLL